MHVVIMSEVDYFFVKYLSDCRIALYDCVKLHVEQCLFDKIDYYTSGLICTKVS